MMIMMITVIAVVAVTAAEVVEEDILLMFDQIVRMKD